MYNIMEQVMSGIMMILMMKSKKMMNMILMSHREVLMKGEMLGMRCRVVGRGDGG